MVDCSPVLVNKKAKIKGMTILVEPLANTAPAAPPDDAVSAVLVSAETIFHSDTSKAKLQIMACCLHIIATPFKMADNKVTSALTV
jgi:hypothetical protein